MKSRSYRKFSVISIFVLCAVLYQQSLFAKETITWVFLDNPPWYIKSGTEQGKGTVDRTVAILKEKLTNYDHKSQKMKIARWVRNTQDGKNLCIGLSYKTEARAKYTSYSIPSNILLSPRVILKAENKPKFGRGVSVSYDSLLGNSDLRGIFEKGRSNAAVDHILEKHKDKSHLEIKPINTQQMFQTVMLGRRDYMTEFPFVAAYHHKISGSDEEYATLAIQEAKPYGLVYVSCPRTPWGESVIKDINEVLRKERPTQRYRDAFEYWLDENSLREYRRYYEEVLLQADE